LKPVSKEVWDFQLSGFYPLCSWLAYRMASPKGKKSSPLDEIRQVTWTASDTEELLRVCWILERTTELTPILNALLDRVLDGPLILAGALPLKTGARTGLSRPGRRVSNAKHENLFTVVGDASPPSED
jgi:hypothetical protein